MLVTLCTIRQLPQALALGDSFSKQTSGAGSSQVVIGLADDPAHLPAGFQSPYPLFPLSEVLSSEKLASLSARYTPTEFAAACKPAFLQEIVRRYPQADTLVYADPNICFLGSTTPIFEKLREANLLLTPFITQAPADRRWPDEKFFQNVGLYSSDFMAFRRSTETDRFLAWWQDRVEPRANIAFCEGLCTDQLWLMHVPVFFLGVDVVKDPAWHVALWNLPHRTLRLEATGWKLADSGRPLLFANVKGLYNPDEGYFPNQNRLSLSNRPDVGALMTSYRQALAPVNASALTMVRPAYGEHPEPVVLRGWRRATVQSLRAVTRFLDELPLPVLR
ncbi:hypothetical protein HNV11_15765 [Spirosoma taeanense]|uniref:Uncharacterized protein n=1 Tax=Spirosoma taeanense TaxID=2735870 RepID=A0A6M5YB23_9BACT|nr:hypothetical protein [Spirosoma taeanense]QJW90734.1 hypothetical protein HNV11_15765 [Spirosoma taeanense]